jgi:sulfate transport system substrate-binding protein
MAAGPVLVSMACAPAGGGASGPSDTLTIGAYSVIREAMREGVLPAFAAEWKQRTGRDVRFEESYNASGAQARAIASGFDADVAILSLDGDVDLLAKAGLIGKDWKARAPRGGTVTRSLVVIGVRPGNPKGIRDWPDLARPGVGVLYADPKTSGGARWNINAIYAAGLHPAGPGRAGPDPDAAFALLASIQKNVLAMDGSGRQSMATFDRGTGDAVVTYENELLLRARQTGHEAPYVVPPATLRIEGPAVVVEANARRHDNEALASAFLAFLTSEKGQRILSEFGFRPLDDALDHRPQPARLLTMADLGGWDRAKTDLYDAGGVWDRLFTDTDTDTSRLAQQRPGKGRAR